MLRLLLVFLLGTASLPGCTQSGVRGTVTDPSKKPVPFCNVFVQRDSVLVKLTATDKLGRFDLAPLDTGNYQLSVTSIGFRKHVQYLRLDVSVIFVEINLLPDTVLLDQVIIRGPGPVQVKGDTVVYDATQFALGDEVALSDLLKKLPGITVEDDGKVKFQGKEVKKIKVEDDDLFDEKYQILTKNLPADLVEQVEVLQNFSDNRLLKNIEDSEDVAINLKLKKDRKQTLFGDARVQSDMHERYEAQGNVVSFSGRLRLYGIANTNNTGEDPTGNADQLIQEPPSQRIPGRDVSSQYLVPVERPSIAQFKRNRYYFNDALLGSLQGIYRPSKNVKLIFHGYSFNEGADLVVANRREYFAPTDTLLFDEAANAHSADSHRFLRGVIELDPAAAFNIRYSARFQAHQGAINQQSNLNQNGVSEILDSRTHKTDHLLTLTHRLSEITALTLDLRYLFDSRPQEYFIDGNLLSDYFITSPASDSLTQFADIPTRFWGGELNLYRKAKSGKIGIRLGYEGLDQEITSALSSTQSALSSNYVVSEQHKTYVEGYYAWKLGRIILTPSASIQLLDFTLSDRGTDPLVFFNPRLGLRWQLTEKSRLTAVYVAGRTTSTLVQLTKAPLLHDYNLLAVNDTSFRKFDTRTLLAGYEFADWGAGFSFFVNFLHNETPSAYLVNADIEPNYVVNTQNQVADRNFSSLSFTLDKFLKSLHSNLKFRWSFNYMDFLTSTESVKASTNAGGHYVEISLRTGLTDPFNFHIGSVLEFASSSSSLIEARNLNSLVYFDVYFAAIQRRLGITLHAERYELNSIDGQPKFHFLDLSARYSVTPANRFTLMLKGRNLLNETTFGQRHVSYQAITTTVNQLIPRYVMAGVEFKF